MIYGLVRLREPTLALVAATSFATTSAMAQATPAAAPALTNATSPQRVNTNMFDQDPPFYNAKPLGIVEGSTGSNGFVSNPIGRIVPVVRADS